MTLPAPPPPAHHDVAPLRVVIVGGGASGVLVAARTLDATGARPVHVTIVEPSERLAAGVAYSTEDPEHLLNVRASGMSADPSRPDDLIDWITARGAGDADTFVSRRDYREYLSAHLRRSADRAPAGRLDVVRDRVVGVEVHGGTARVSLATGSTLAADRVVLAIGNSSPGVPDALAALDDEPAWVPDPWAPGTLDALGRAGRVLLVGTGLTMVDIAITLGRTAPTVAAGPSPQARLMAISRHGLLPMRHLARQPYRPLHVVDLDRDAVDVMALAERIRARIEEQRGCEYPDEDWREVIDAVRPFANALWRRLDLDQQRVFLQRLLRDWEVRRHRMSPDTARRFDALRTEGHLTTHTGQVLEAVPDGSGGVRLRLERDGRVQELHADAVVNCTGPGRSWMPPANPVVSDLIERGLAVPDPHGLGLVTSPEGRLVDVDGDPVPEIMVIGPPRRGSLFETTAVPELRSQALHLADHLVIGDAVT